MLSYNFRLSLFLISFLRHDKIKVMYTLILLKSIGETMIWWLLLLLFLVWNIKKNSTDYISIEEFSDENKNWIYTFFRKTFEIFFIKWQNKIINFLFTLVFYCDFLPFDCVWIAINATHTMIGDVITIIGRFESIHLPFYHIYSPIFAQIFHYLYVSMFNHFLILFFFLSH